MTMGNLKILHYTPVYAPAWKFGGPIQSISQLCEALAIDGHDVEVFTSDAGLEAGMVPINQPILRNKVKVTYFAQTSGRGIQCTGMEQAIAQRAHEFDLIHVTAIWQPTSRAACTAAKQAQVPYIISPRGSLGTYGWQHKTVKKILFYLWQEQFNLARASAIHYTSEQEYEECQWLTLPPAFIVPNGLNTEFWQPDHLGAKQWRQAHNLTENEFLLLSVGRLHHKKGLDLLPSAMAMLSDRRWKLVFVGNDDDGTQIELQTAFSAAGLSDRVLFINSHSPERLSAVYTAANLFVLPSRHENFGNVVVEALACGCPVMISDKVGLHREIKAGNMGWICPRDPQIWAAMIQKLIDAPDLLARISDCSRSWIEAKFSVHQTAQQMVEQYRSLIELHRIQKSQQKSHYSI